LIFGPTDPSIDRAPKSSPQAATSPQQFAARRVRLSSARHGGS
jgi:hypothetical protein